MYYDSYKISGVRVATETIVAKKPKSSFVYNLLAAKEKLKLQNSTYPDATPPRYLEETFNIKSKKAKNNNNTIFNEVKSSKVRPQLKAQPTIKTYNDEEHNEWDTVTEEEEEELEELVRSTSSMENDDMELEEEIQEENEIIENIQSNSSKALPEEMKLETCKLQNGSQKETESEDVVEEVNVEEVNVEDNRCILTADLLEVDKLRVLTAMGGLFYAGRLNALEPPDVYSITLDGERGNKPHIMSREEILRDAVSNYSKCWF